MVEQKPLKLKVKGSSPFIPTNLPKWRNGIRRRFKPADHWYVSSTLTLGTINEGVAELVDALVLETSIYGCVGSNPTTLTNIIL